MTAPARLPCGGASHRTGWTALVVRRLESLAAARTASPDQRIAHAAHAVRADHDAHAGRRAGAVAP